MTEPRLTKAQYMAAYKAWMDVRTRIDDSSRAVIAAIAEHVQYSSEAAQEPRFTLAEIEAAILAQGMTHGGRLEFARAIRARLSPAPPDRAPEERVTVRRVAGSGVGVFDGDKQQGPCFLTHEDAQRHRTGLIAELSSGREDGCTVGAMAIHGASSSRKQTPTEMSGRIERMETNSVIARAAKAAHEANRVLCLALGDTSQPKWEDAPEWQQSSATNGVKMILDNPATTPEQSHEGWLAEKTATGWKYGPVKNPETKEHPCFVPYGELPENQRLKDEMFGLVVRAVLAI